MRFKVHPIHHPFALILDREEVLDEAESPDFAIALMHTLQSNGVKCAVLDTGTSDTVNVYYDKRWREEDEP